MPEYLSPGVYVEEISTGPRPIEGVGTSTPAFVGQALRGPEYPTLVTSWLQFQRRYGGYIADSYLAYAVQGFFENGGQRCFVSRVVTSDVPKDGQGNDVPNHNPATASTVQIDDLHVVAIGRGAWGDRVTITVQAATRPQDNTANKWFKITIQYGSDPVEVPPEVYDNVSTDDASSSSLTKTINASSRLVRVAWDSAAQHNLTVQQAGLSLQGGNNGSRPANPMVSAADYEGTKDGEMPMPATVSPYAKGEISKYLRRGSGLEAISLIDEVAMLSIPDEVNFPPGQGATISPITSAVINQCENLKDRFAICSALQGGTKDDSSPPQDTKYAAFYGPWIKIFDPNVSDYKLIPPTGHIAGIFARTDIERGVHKAPANEIVRGATELEVPIDKGLQDILNPKGVNCIRDFRTDRRGIRLWGARTMSSDPLWKYVNVRRLFIFIEESIDEGTQWVVFEPNDYTLWEQVRRTITNFLVRVWRSGALLGLTEDEAFFVKCDRTTMTQDDIDNGRLICYIGIAPVKPAEFVIFRISQFTAEANQS